MKKTNQVWMLETLTSKGRWVPSTITWLHSKREAKKEMKRLKESFWYGDYKFRAVKYVAQKEGK